MKLNLSLGRHPVVSTLPLQQLSSSFVANDLFLSPLENVHVITGPNGAGKVRYILNTFILCFSKYFFHIATDCVHQANRADCDFGADWLLCACQARDGAGERSYSLQTRYLHDA